MWRWKGGQINCDAKDWNLGEQDIAQACLRELHGKRLKHVPRVVAPRARARRFASRREGNSSPGIVLVKVSSTRDVAWDRDVSCGSGPLVGHLPSSLREQRRVLPGCVPAYNSPLRVLGSALSSPQFTAGGVTEPPFRIQLSAPYRRMNDNHREIDRPFDLYRHFSNSALQITDSRPPGPTMDCRPNPSTHLKHGTPGTRVRTICKQHLISGTYRYGANHFCVGRSKLLTVPSGGIGVVVPLYFEALRLQPDYAQRVVARGGEGRSHKTPDPMRVGEGANAGSYIILHLPGTEAPSLGPVLDDVGHRT
eukprot:gene15064-biopygen5163